MNILLWILQVALGVYFLSTGVTHFVVPEGLPDQLGWMYDLSDTAHYVAGTAEILGGLGLVLPSLTRIQPQLTVWAALGLLLIMVLAAFWHLGREEYTNIVTNAIVAIALAVVAYGRWRTVPIAPRGAAAPS